MLCYPGYRYWGPGCHGPGAPVNKLDAICLEHDNCYRMSGNRKMCDQMFINRTRPLINQPGKMGRDAAIMSALIQIKLMF